MKLNFLQSHLKNLRKLTFNFERFYEKFSEKAHKNSIDLALTD